MNIMDFIEPCMHIEDKGGLIFSILGTGHEGGIFSVEAPTTRLN